MGIDLPGPSCLTESPRVHLTHSPHPDETYSRLHLGERRRKNFWSDVDREGSIVFGAATGFHSNLNTLDLT